MKLRILLILACLCWMAVGPSYAQNAEGQQMLAKARKGDNDAIWKVASWYEDGIMGFPQDKEKSNYWFLKATPIKGFDFAKLAVMYLKGDVNFPKDINKAEEYAIKACEMDYITMWLIDPFSENPNELQFIKELLTNLAIKDPAGRATEVLIIKYENGGFGNVSYMVPLEWRKKGIEAGNSKFAIDLMYYFASGRNGYPKDHHEAVKWGKKALELVKVAYVKNEIAIKLGELLKEIGLKDEALEMFKIGYDNAESDDKKGSCAYDIANLSKGDKYEYLTWMKTAASLNYSPALYALGLYYRDVNRDEAVYWFKKRADLEYEENGKIDARYSIYELEQMGIYYHPEDKSTTGSSSSTSSNHSHSHASSNSQSSKQSSSSSYTPEYGYRDVWVDCSHCHGDGKCPSCGGVGWCVSTYSNGNYNTTYTCPVCHGNRFCTICGGTKGHYEKQMYQIK